MYVVIWTSELTAITHQVESPESYGGVSLPHSNTEFHFAVSEPRADTLQARICTLDWE